MRPGSRLHRVWAWWVEYLPAWPWRAYCWLCGHVEDTYGACAICGARYGRQAPCPCASQTLPVPNDGPHVHDLVVADLAARKALGTQRYGTPLQPHNGRDALCDAYEEALDLAVYLRQALEERLAQP